MKTHWFRQEKVVRNIISVFYVFRVTNGLRKLQFRIESVIVTFYQLMLVVTGVMHEADNAYSIRSTWMCYRLVRFLITAYIC